MDDVTLAPAAIVTQIDEPVNVDSSAVHGIPPVDSIIQSDSVRLSDMLRADTMSVESSEVLSGTGEPSSEGTQEDVLSLGDQILARLDAVGDSYKQNVSRVYTALDKSPRDNTVEELLKMQLDIAVVSLEVEVIGKGVQKSVQHVETLSKMQ